MSRPWANRSQELDQIQDDLRIHFPNLHLFVNRDGLAEINGVFPVRGVNGEELDRYNITIILSETYPKDLPVVREVGGRIPWDPDFHVELLTGKACVIFPDDRWRCFPNGSSFLEYLQIPLHNFYLGQTVHFETGKWPFDEWAHGLDGVYDYYHWLLKTDDNVTVHRFLYVLGKLRLKEYWECPCGSGKKIRQCCRKKLLDLRTKIPPSTARKSYSLLGLKVTPYNGPRIRRQTGVSPKYRR